MRQYVYEAEVRIRVLVPAADVDRDEWAAAAAEDRLREALCAMPGVDSFRLLDWCHVETVDDDDA